MKFGPLPVGKAEGAVLAHSLALASGKLAKGRVLSAEDVALIAGAGLHEVVAATLEPGDVGEDEAALRIAHALAGPGVRVDKAFTGRCNMFADMAGLMRLDGPAVAKLNAVHESITVATLPGFSRVAEGRMAATVKIIPFAAPEDAVREAEKIAQAAPLTIAPFKAMRAGLVLTTLPGLKQSLVEKARRALTDRVEACGARVGDVCEVAHEAGKVAEAVKALAGKGLSPLLIFPASAIVDRGDVVPGGLVEAGGEVIHLGMPVDPGNLMMLGRHGHTPVLGVPSCARSPKLNGFDWVLERVLAGIEVSPSDIQMMGAGGLLMEIGSRPQPRRGGKRAKAKAGRKIAGLILAAGRSTRMGARNKLLEPLGGRPMLAHVAGHIAQAGLDPVVAVTGHEAEAVKATLKTFKVTFIHNPDFAQGLSTSLRAGLAALPRDVAGALVCLGDMPDISAAHLQKLIAAFVPDEGREICVPVVAGKRGNPVLWGRAFFDEMMELEGDVGARHLIGRHEARIVEVEFDDEAALNDIDTPAAADAARTRFAKT